MSVCEETKKETKGGIIITLHYERKAHTFVLSYRRLFITYCCFYIELVIFSASETNPLKTFPLLYISIVYYIY